MSLLSATVSFGTVVNYTTLKASALQYVVISSFGTVVNYTTLKEP